MERVIRIRSGKYFVQGEDGVYECTAKGSLKVNSDGIVAGDFVQTENGVITRVSQRKNRLPRPNVANVDAVAIILADPPSPDFFLVDKLVAAMKRAGVDTIIIVNKIDISNGTFIRVEDNYGNAAERIFAVSAKTEDGLEPLKAYLKGKLTVFTGQSAVGKTSLINKLLGKDMRTGELSKKTERGKQTTTVAEIIENDGISIADTPGFSAFEPIWNAREISLNYSDFQPYAPNCRFADCTHISEPDCAVRVAVENGEINAERYSRYVEIYKKAKEKDAYDKKY